MKKFYSLIVATLLSLIGIEANAFTLFVDIDDRTRISEITTYPAQAAPVDLDADEISVQFADNAAMRYITVTANEGIYITHYTIVDEDGRELASKANATGKLSYISIPKEADYGKIIITTATELKNDAQVKVTLVGDPNKASLAISGKREAKLTQGEQQIEFLSATESGTWYLMPVGVSTLYKVQVNGETVGVSSGWDGQFQYYLHVTNGDEIYIETDYPDISYKFSLAVPEGLEAMVESVTVDGTPIDDWKDTTIKIGSHLVVTMNDGDYKLSKFTVNDGDNMVGLNDEWGIPVFYNSWGTLVDQDIHIVADGTYIERPYSFHVQLYGMGLVYSNQEIEDGNGASAIGTYYFARSSNKPLQLTDQCDIKFCEEDNPFRLDVTSFSETEDVQITVQVNGRTIEDKNGRWQLTFEDNDCLAIFFGVDPLVVPADSPTAATHRDATYNLAGQRVDKPAKGLYIQGGKKTVIN